MTPAPERPDRPHVETMTPEERSVHDALLPIGDFGVVARHVTKALIADGWTFAAAPVTDADPREALRDLLTTPCDCDEAWTARGLHAPDCRYSFIHAFLDDDEIARFAAVPVTDAGLGEALIRIRDIANHTDLSDPNLVAIFDEASAALSRQAEKETA